jgi:hypothetical protein
MTNFQINSISIPFYTLPPHLIQGCSFIYFEEYLFFGLTSSNFLTKSFAKFDTPFQYYAGNETFPLLIHSNNSFISGGYFVLNGN